MLEIEENERILTIDFVRGISVLLMIPVHCMIIYSDTDTWKNSILGKIIQVIECGSPMFLIAMGISFAFSKRQDFKTMIIRGLTILGIGYLLNGVRFLIPMVFFGGLPELFLTANDRVQGDPANFIYFLLLGDIFQLAGLSVLFMTGMMQLTKNKNMYLILGLIIVALSRKFSGFRVEIIGFDYICDLLWGNQYNVYFPIFPWMSFILLGLFFGIGYREEKNNVVFVYKKMVYYSIGFIVLGLLLCMYNYEYHFGDYYHLGPGGSIMLMGIDLLLIWISHLFVKYSKPNKLYKLFYYSSKNVSSFYVIQWILISWGMVLFGYSNRQTISLLFLIVSITLLTFVLLQIKDRFFGAKIIFGLARHNQTHRNKL